MTLSKAKWLSVELRRESKADRLTSLLAKAARKGFLPSRVRRKLQANTRNFALFFWRPIELQTSSRDVFCHLDCTCARARARMFSADETSTLATADFCRAQRMSNETAAAAAISSLRVLYFEYPMGIFNNCYEFPILHATPNCQYPGKQNFASSASAVYIKRTHIFFFCLFAGLAVEVRK